MAKKPFIIALEEHYLDPEVKQLGGGPGADRDIVERLDDRGALRIREMDDRFGKRTRPRQPEPSSCQDCEGDRDLMATAVPGVDKTRNSKRDKSAMR